MIVRDVTTLCADGRREPLGPDDLCALWLHRIGRQIGADAVDIASWFIRGDGARYTGGQMPYHYVVTQHGVQQALPLDERGAHARRWGNAHGIGIAVQGDFRSQEPSERQWDWAAELCADLLPALGPIPEPMLGHIPMHLLPGLPVYGHGEVPIAYGRDSEKHTPTGRYACPGQYWAMDSFREAVRDELRRRSVGALMAGGHRLHST